LDPPSCLSERIDIVFEFLDDRRHTYPTTNIVRHLFLLTVDLYREYVGGHIGDGRFVFGVHGIEISRHELACQLSNLISINGSGVLS